MASAKDKYYVSFWFWLFAMFVMAIPIIGWIMIIVWAFAGENETRKNYFRAIIACFLIFSAIWAGLMSIGFWPLIEKKFQLWLQH